MSSAPSASARRDPSSTTDAPRQAAHEVADNKWGERALRFGIAARGFVFVVIAYLVARIAMGALGQGSSTNKSASGAGAAHQIAQQTGGHVALVLLGVGMVFFATFCVVDAIRNKGDEDSAAKRWAERGAAGWRAALYTAFGIYCFVTVASGTSSGTSNRSNRRQTQWSAEVLRWPAGWFWLGLLGALLFVAAGVQAWRCVKRTFCKHLEEGRMGPRARQLATVLGTIGYAGRAGAYGLVGWFVLSAAIENDPKKGKGVDGSARLLAQHTGGALLLWLLAIALGVFGLYMFVESRYRKV